MMLGCFHQLVQRFVVLYREFSGRGLLQWAKGGVGQYLKGGHGIQGTVQLQVETLSGLLLALDLVSTQQAFCVQLI